MNLAKAINTRRKDALEMAGTTRKDMIEQIAREVTANVRIYAGADGVKSEEEFVASMRKRGGFSSFIRVSIGPEPPSKQNEIGIQTNPEWWIWEILTNATDEIREKVQIALAGEWQS